MDVSNAFLNGLSEHEMYMDPHEVFIDAIKPAHVYKLHKSEYGLKQSPREWYNTIRPMLEAVGTTCPPGDSGIFLVL